MAFSSSALPNTRGPGQTAWLSFGVLVMNFGCREYDSDEIRRFLSVSSHFSPDWSARGLRSDAGRAVSSSLPTRSRLRWRETVRYRTVTS